MMQGLLMKLQSVEGTLFNSEHRRQYFFVLKNQVLTFSEEKDKSKTLGQLHMAISTILPEQPNDTDCDIRLHSGLVELRLRAPTIKDKIDWINAFNRSKKDNEGVAAG